MEKPPIYKLICELLALPDYRSRIEAVSEDVHSGALRYAKIYPFVLVKVLGIEPLKIDTTYVVLDEEETGKAGILIYAHTVSDRKGRTMDFTVEHGDGGECIGVLTPYRKNICYFGS